MTRSRPPAPPPTSIPILALALALAALPAAAQDRPREEEVFGAPPAEPAKEAPKEEPRRPSDADVFGKPAAPSGEAPERPAAEARLRSRLGETDNPLQIGGQLYLRANAQAVEDTSPSRWLLSAPSLADVYLDARPSDRVRGFGLVRTFYDPTLTSPSLPTGLQGPSQVSSSSQEASLQGVLDQLWMRFDAGRAVFFTAGKQHVKWGVGRFWNPTDFLHARRRNPLATFDDRTGTTMLKAHIPWERRGWNFYAMAVAEPLAPEPRSAFYAPPLSATDQVGAVGGAGRAEVVLGGWEVGIDGAAQRGMNPRLGLDFSTGIWEVDVRGELALRRGTDGPLWRVPDPGTVDPAALRYRPTGLRTAAVLAAEWQKKYSDEDTFTIGAEYFWNESGYSDAHVYPVLFLVQAFNPFYLGQHYAGLYLQLPKPGSWNLHTFTFSALGNLSDGSYLGRIDWSVTLLTYLTFEAYLAGHFGSSGGEFRLGLDVPSRLVILPSDECQSIGGTPTQGAPSTCATPAIRRGAPLVDVGVALRMSL